MSEPDLDDITQLLRAAHNGDQAAFDRLMPRVYDELRVMAQRLLREERADHTLQPTALVHEAWLKLAGQDSLGFRDRARFFATAATLMRRVLVDHARARQAAKRGGGRRAQTLDDAVAALESRAGDLVALEGAIEKLAGLHARKARLIELRFFLGMSMREAAEVLGTSLRQAERDWTLARAWIRRQLDGGTC